MRQLLLDFEKLVGVHERRGRVHVEGLRVDEGLELSYFIIEFLLNFFDGLLGVRLVGGLEVLELGDDLLVHHRHSLRAFGLRFLQLLESW